MSNPQTQTSKQKLVEQITILSNELASNERVFDGDRENQRRIEIGTVLKEYVDQLISEKEN